MRLLSRRVKSRGQNPSHRKHSLTGKNRQGPPGGSSGEAFPPGPRGNDKDQRRRNTRLQAIPRPSEDFDSEIQRSHRSPVGFSVRGQTGQESRPPRNIHSHGTEG